MQPNKAHVRLLIVATLAFVWMTAVFGRLAYLQLFRHRDYLTRAQKQQQHSIEITPKRGVIYDRNLHALAMSIEVDSAYAVPSEIVDQQLAAKLLAGVLDMPRDVLEAKLDGARSFVWIARKLPPAKKEAIEALNLKGVYFEKENQRFYPKRDLASHVLGYVDLDEKGLGGIEQKFDHEIRAKSEKILVMTDGRQRWFDGGEAQRERGANVVLTLDEKIQYIAERELAAAIANTHAMAGTVVVMNPNNGEVLAMANWPKFNPNASSSASADSRMNRAVTALYEPGSTFKLITLAAAIDQNLTRPEEVFNCENGAIYIAGHRIRDHKPFGLLNVSEILANSSDVGAIKIALRLGPQKFHEYIKAFGFGQLTKVELPGESYGIVRKLDNWTPVSIGSISMGQEVGVTPIQLTAAISAIANGGLLYKPHVVSKVVRGDQVLPAEGAAPEMEPKRVIRPETAATLRQMMEGVILNGTGTKARLDGWTAAGKTGSAQKIDTNTGRYSPTQLIASFSGFAPINNPAVTILVSLDSPVGLHEGGQVAAPVFKRIAEQVLPYLDVPRDVPVRARLMQASLRSKTEPDVTALEDFTPADFSSLPDQPPTVTEAKPQEIMPEVMVAADEGGDIPVPDFSGKTMREITQLCLKLGLDPTVLGSGIAVSQAPAAGAKVRRGARITVQFGDAMPKQPAASKGKRKAH